MIDSLRLLFQVDCLGSALSVKLDEVSTWTYLVRSPQRRGNLKRLYIRRRRKVETEAVDRCSEAGARRALFGSVPQLSKK